MALPVVFIHQRDSEYLYNTFYQIRKKNSESPVYLIGTKESKRYRPLIEHIDISDYSTEATAFSKIYKHLSPNGYVYEMFCIQRWFVLKEFLESRQIERCLYLDSDVLFYSNVDEVAQHFQKYGMTISKVAGHTNFVTLTVLKEFCKYIIDCYAREDSTNLLQGYHDEFYSNFGGGVSDMTFLWKFQMAHPDKIFDYLNWKDISGETIDHTLNNSDGWDKRFVMDGKILKTIWKNNMPYYIDAVSGKEVMTHSMHFQGGSKAIMENYVPVKNYYYHYLKLSSRIIFYFRKQKVRIMNVLRRARKS